MRISKAHLGVAVGALLTAAGVLVVPVLSGWDGVGTALAATSEQKAAFQQVLKSLQAVDTAYAAGNTAEAQSNFNEAKSNWDKLSPAISNREAREQQLLFNSLADLLKKNAAAADVKDTVNSMLGELRSEIREELE